MHEAAASGPLTYLSRITRLRKCPNLTPVITSSGSTGPQRSGSLLTSSSRVVVAQAAAFYP